MALDSSRYDGQITDGAAEYNLLYAESSPAQTELLPLQAQRVDTGNVSEARPESGLFFSQNDFSGGAYQEFFHTPGSLPNGYYLSKNLAIGRRGTVSLERAVTEREHSGAGLNYNPIVEFNGILFWAGDIDGTDYVVTNTTDFSTFNEEDPHAGETKTIQVYDLASSGQHLYAALDTNGVHRRTTSGTWSHFAAVTNAQRLAWVKDRLFVSGGSSGVPHTLYEVDSAGTGITTHITLGAPWRFTSIFEVGPFIYAIAVNHEIGGSRIYHLGLNSAGTDIEQKGSTLPPDKVWPTAGIAAGGQAYLSGYQETDVGGFAHTFWVGIPSATGELTLVKVADGEDRVTSLAGAANNHGYHMVVDGERILLPWAFVDLDGSTVRSGAAAYYVATGAFVPGVLVTDNAGSIESYRRRIVENHAETLFYQDDADKAATGELITSTADFNNAGMKLWDEIRITHKRLPTGGAIAVYYSTQHPNANSWTLAGTSNTAASEGKTFDLSNVKSRILALKFVFTRGSIDVSLTPELINFTVRAFPCAEQTSDIEWRFARDVRIVKGDRKDHNPPDHSTSGPWGGNVRTRRKALQDLAYKKVTLTEPDATWSVRVVGIADVEPMQPIVTSTETDEAYVMRLTFEGRRTA